MMCLSGAFASGEAHPPDSPEALLWEVRQAHRRGDFELAWDAYMRFFKHPDRNRVDMLTFAYCFKQEQCPDLGRLGAFLRKTKREFDALGRFCPQWRETWEAELDEDAKPSATAGEIEFIKTVPDRILTGGLGTDCAGWPEIVRPRLHNAQSSRRALQKDVVPIRLTGDEWGFRPEVKLGVGRSDTWALLDTGATDLTFDADEWFRKSLAIENLEIVGTNTMSTRYGNVFSRAARLPNLRLGNTSHHDVTVSAIEADAAMRGVQLGMTVLLRYKSVCFAWKEMRLHLGDLGPCAGGAEPHQAILSPWFIPFVEVASQEENAIAASYAVENGSHAYARWKRASSQSWVLVDTGAMQNHCSDSFASKVGQRFRFGENDLTAACTNVGDAMFEHFTGEVAAILGMETLLEFDAFGWELNPFRLYFVPKATDP